MWICDTIDLDDHNEVIKFLKQQSDKIKLLENEKIGLEETVEELSKKVELLNEDINYYLDTYKVQDYGLDIESHVQIPSGVMSRKELLQENERLLRIIFNLEEEKNNKGMEK